MNDYQKKEIQILLAEYVKKFKSQAKAAESLTNVSEATLIQVKSGRWDNISEAMWIKIGKQVGYTQTGKWNMAPTKPFNALIKLFKTAKENVLTLAIAIPSGRGKSFAIKWFADHNENVFPVVCAEYMSSKDLLGRILRKMGLDAIGSASVMMETIVNKCFELKDPIIVLDEFDKLKDKQKYFFITLFNMLEDQCSLVITGTRNMEHQIMKKTTKHTIGYEEIFSRIGRRFIAVPESTIKDVTAICEANGLTDPEQIHSVFNECNGDLRRIKTAVRKAMIKAENETHLEAA
jgi:Cdc6-like AAA superfamily ATPase